MPIGLLIGWLIGQIYIGAALATANGDPQTRTEDQTHFLVRKGWAKFGLILFWTGMPALIGTLIELWIVHG